MEAVMCFKQYWKSYVIVGAPVVLLPLLTEFQAQEARCAYGMLLMALYWMTEALPLPVTALLPMVLFPMMGIVPAKKLALNYFKDTVAMFVGGLMVAVSIEKSDLHRRIAIGVLRLVGARPHMLLAGFMIPTWFLSMWISNTATTAMMVPVANAVLLQLRKSIVTSEDDPAAANVGGTATLTGTGPNLVFKNTVDDVWRAQGLRSPVSFASWMAFGLPSAFLCLLLIWLWMVIYFLGPRTLFCCCRKKSEPENSQGVKLVIQEEYKKLGSIRFAEVSNIVFFLLLVLLWLTRDPGFATGWASFFPDGYVTDSTPALLVAVLLFIMPSYLPSVLCFRRRQRPTRELMLQGDGLLDWNTVALRLPWGVLLLLGGGFALAEAAQTSGLSALIGRQLAGLSVLPPWVIVLVVASLTAVMTEMTANTPTSQLLLPILATLAVELRLHPLYLMLPCAVAASYAFCLPVATPPNAIVFSYGHLKVIDMAKCGLMLNVLCVLVVTLGVHTWGEAYFRFSAGVPWDTQTLNSTELPRLTTT